MIPLTCVGRSSEDLLGAMIGSWSWKMQVRISDVATMTMGAVFFGVTVLFGEDEFCLMSRSCRTLVCLT